MRTVSLEFSGEVSPREIWAVLQSLGAASLDEEAPGSITLERWKPRGVLFLNFDLGPEARGGITVERLPPKAVGVAIVASIGTGEASDDLAFTLAKSLLGRWPGVISCGGSSWTLADAEAHWAKSGRYPWVDEANVQARAVLEKMRNSRRGPFRE